VIAIRFENVKAILMYKQKWNQKYSYITVTSYWCTCHINTTTNVI